LSYPFFRLEQMVSSRADAAIVIAPAFADILASWGVPGDRVSVIENWAPLDEIPPFPRANEWSARHGLGEKTVFLYSGTLGIKHRPDLLYHLARSLDSSCRVVVITEGIGRDYLRKMPPLETLQLLDFQPYDQVPLVLAGADVLLATLESDAGQFAVPSKVLSYLCAGRPLLLAAPKINLAAEIVERSSSGFVADPDRPEEFVGAAKRLAADAGLRCSLAANARRYAEREFEISRLAARFEEILLKASPSIRSAVVSRAPFAEPPLSVAAMVPGIQTSQEN
jgi:glycosyltransferase involved in cell wall biosynthesis